MPKETAAISIQRSHESYQQILGELNRLLQEHAFAPDDSQVTTVSITATTIEFEVIYEG